MSPSGSLLAVPLRVTALPEVTVRSVPALATGGWFGAKISIRNTQCNIRINRWHHQYHWQITATKEYNTKLEYLTLICLFLDIFIILILILLLFGDLIDIFIITLLAMIQSIILLLLLFLYEVRMNFSADSLWATKHMVSNTTSISNRRFRKGQQNCQLYLQPHWRNIDPIPNGVDISDTQGILSIYERNGRS